MNILYGILTTIFLLGVGYLFSENRKAINWRTVGIGLLAQIVMMFFVLKTSIGQWILKGISNGITTVLGFSSEGISFVFGDSLIGTGAFAITVLSVICFTGSLIALLYYLKVIPFFVRVVGGLVSKIMGTTPVESFCGVGNAFLSATESPLLTKPFLKDLTRSELFAVILGGFASVSVSVVLGYSTMGINMEYIMVQMATVPFATLLMAKMLVPETEESKTTEIKIEGSEHSNIFDAIGSGAMDGLNIALSVGAVLIGFISLIALVNFVLGWFGTSLTEIFTIMLYPLAKLMGIPSNEIATFTSAIGLKTAVNEYVAIGGLTEVMSTLSIRTQAMLGIALVNFANFSVIGITIGGFKTFCPEKADEVTSLGFKALLGGVLTSLISASLMGMFF